MSTPARVYVLRGDITTLKVDAIVNAANSSLMGGGGVDGAIHRAGGPAILDECRQIIARQGRCDTGRAVITTGGNLPASYVIHTVGPVWNGGRSREHELLASCYRHSLQLAETKKCRSIAFPNISTGIYGFPKEQAAIVATTAVSAFLLQNKTIEQVYFVCFDEDNFRLINQALDKPES
jgi:O-acetyl-ADP-ribose deacetylase (regulator of RNase III)